MDPQGTFNKGLEREPLKERSRPSVSNVTSADVRFATTGSRGRHCLTSRNQSVNRTDWSTEIIQ